MSERRNMLVRSSHNGVSNGVNRKRYSPTSDTGIENDNGVTESEEVMGEEEEEEVEEEMESESNKPDLNTSNVSLFSSPQPTGTTTSNPFKVHFNRLYIVYSLFIMYVRTCTCTIILVKPEHNHTITVTTLDLLSLYNVK